MVGWLIVSLRSLRDMQRSMARMVSWLIDMQGSLIDMERSISVMVRSILCSRKDAKLKLLEKTLMWYLSRNRGASCLSPRHQRCPVMSY